MEVAQAVVAVRDAQRDYSAAVEKRNEAERAESDAFARLLDARTAFEEVFAQAGVTVAVR